MVDTLFPWNIFPGQKIVIHAVLYTTIPPPLDTSTFPRKTSADKYRLTCNPSLIGFMLAAKSIRRKLTLPPRPSPPPPADGRITKRNPGFQRSARYQTTLKGFAANKRRLLVLLNTRVCIRENNFGRRKLTDRPA